ncbi:MAG: hypothetical protein IT376_18390 [Polyangiaceae bacterium]|nr:hypothetical protein [Polyangiaceae bacterium]
MSRILRVLALGTVWFAIGCDRGLAPIPGAGASASASATAAAGVAAARLDAATDAEAPGDDAAFDAPDEPSPGAAASAAAADAGAPRARKRKRSRSVAKASAAPEVKVLEPGTPPRTELRYVFRAGSKERLRMVNRTQVEVVVGEQKAPSPAAPDVEITATLAVLELLSGDRARRELTIDRFRLLETPGVDAGVRAQISGALAGIEGLTGTDVVDTRGVLREVRLDTSNLENPSLELMMDSMQQSFGQMGAPFPEAPIGVGARWRVRSSVDQQGMRLTQTATYTLLAREGTRGRVRVELAQRAPASKARPPGLPPGVDAEFLGMSASGAGELEFELTRGIPQGELKSSSKVRMKAGVGGVQRDVTMQMTTAVRFERVE